MMRFFSKAWLRVLSGLFVNFSAAAFIAGASGGTIFPPRNLDEILTLIFYFVLGIIFLLLTVRIEEELLK